MFINIYYYKKGINNEEKNLLFIKEIDNVIDWIYKAYKSIEEVINTILIFVLYIIINESSLLLIKAFFEDFNEL